MQPAAAKVFGMCTWPVTVVSDARQANLSLGCRKLRLCHNRRCRCSGKEAQFEGSDRLLIRPVTEAKTKMSVTIEELFAAFGSFGCFSTVLNELSVVTAK